MVECEYFTTEKLIVDGKCNIEVSKDRFEVLMVCEGSVTITDRAYKKGDTIFVPAYIGNVELNGNAVVLRSFVHC